MPIKSSDPFYVTEEAIAAMLKHFRHEYPREGCGFLAGKQGIAHRFYPVNNLNPDLRRFFMDPRHVQRTELSILRRGQRILGVCYSHPDGECFPSPWDLRGSFLDPLARWPLWSEEIHIIALMEPCEAPRLGAFRISPEGGAREVPLERKVLDPPQTAVNPAIIP